jgi:hypothetical protein
VSLFVPGIDEEEMTLPKRRVNVGQNTPSASHLESILGGSPERRTDRSGDLGEALGHWLELEVMDERARLMAQGRLTLFLGVRCSAQPRARLAPATWSGT